MEFLSKIDSSIYAAVISLLVSIAYSHFYARKKEWKDTKGLLLDRFNTLYQSVLKLAKEPRPENPQSLLFQFRQEVIFLAHISVCFKRQKDRITKMEKALLCDHKELILDEDFEEILLKTGMSSKEYPRFVESLQAIIVNQCHQLIPSSSKNV